MNAIAPIEQSRETRLTSEMHAFFSLAMGERRRAHAYRRWAIEAEAAGNMLGHQAWREASDKQWRGAWWALRKTRERKDELSS